MRYLNFDLEAFDYKQTAAGDQFSVRVADSPGGQQRIAEAEKVRLAAHVRQSVAALQRRQLPMPEIIALGEKLGEALFPARVRSFLSASLTRLSEEEGLRIRVKLGTYGLAELPWEYAYLPMSGVPGERRGAEGFVALNRRVSLVRYEPQEGALVPIQAGVGPLRLVAFLASPVDPSYEQLDVAREQKIIEQALADLPAIHAEFYPDATADTLLDALVKPAHIFHFAGHGQFTGSMGESYGSQEGAGAVILLGDRGGAISFPAQRLALNLAARGVRLAVLTTCDVARGGTTNAWAGVVTALTRAGIPAVLGMQFSIRDSNALAFSRAFYHALAAGQPIDAAVADGRFAIFNREDEYDRDWGVPVLYLRAEDGVLFPEEGQLASAVSAAPRVPTGTLPQGATPALKSGQPGMVDKRLLRDAMMKGFSAAELELLCSDVEENLARDGIELQLNLDVVGGESKPLQVWNLITYLDRRGYLAYLDTAVRSARPGIMQSFSA